MIHNGVLRSVRFMLNVGDHTIADIIQLGGLEVPLDEVAGYLAKEDERGYRECPDLVMAHFLDGLIVHCRGKNEKLADRPVDPAITNNIVLKKLRVAFELKEDDILSMMAAAQQPVSKPELSALFRRPGHKNYRPCGDQFLRKFLASLTQRVRG